ncbi:pyridoxamine 5'-phosphate oxidase family protein [Herbiconiux moechotypicola]|nr:pyridoxamine 5'-phosphate oxidase family protein [Herbiconiux moechotypicola]MCS5731829.1 pyridoxamine 5'-phosphate oxidase family protein [Herbiconiux moechotypicola]
MDERVEQGFNPYYRVRRFDDEAKLPALTEAECWERLGEAEVARLAVVDDGGADIFPVNVLVREGVVYFRSAPGGKIVDLTAHPGVAVEVDGRHATGWWSVVVRGAARRLNDDEEIEAVGIAALPTLAPTNKWNYFAITPTAVTGVHFDTAPS